ncbi:MAG: DEAD/DEAH box helicase [Patulibacter sp.]
MTDFADLRLSEPILRALQDLGYERPSPIQAEAIPELLAGRDMIGQAQTGSGKTAAFGLPLLQAIDTDETTVQALVLTPTRELCIQVTQALRAYGVHKGIEVVATFGGAPIRTQQAQLKGAQVVVGTVGRVLDLISRHSLILHDCRFVVLDEADEMLDLGFLEDVEKIIKLCPNGRQTALFSATMPPPIAALADNYLYDPALVKVKSDTLTVDRIDMFHVMVPKREKADRLVEVVKSERPEQAIVFCRTKLGCEQLFRKLRDGGMNVKALHGDMSQGQRDGVMLSFKAGRVAVLVATDVAARGLDIDSVTHVINYDVPTSPDVYVHRIGRTGRAGRQGRAITFIEPSQTDALDAIERHINDAVPEWAPGKVGVRFGGAADGDAPAAATPTSDEARLADAAAPDGAPVRKRRNRSKADSEPSRAPQSESAASTAAGAPAQSDAGKARDGDDSDDRERGPRHSRRRGRKPGLSRGDGPLTSVVAQLGAVDGVSVADVVRAITDASALDGEAVRDVRVRERFTLLRIPTAELGTVLASAPAIDGRDLALTTLG